MVTYEADVQIALALLLDANEAVSSDSVKEVIGNAEPPAVPELSPGVVDLAAYDELLSAEAVSA